MKLLVLFLVILTLTEAYKHKKGYKTLRNHKKNDKTLHLLSNRVLHKHDNTGKKHMYGHWGEHYGMKHKKHMLGHMNEHWGAKKHKSWANQDMHLQNLDYLNHKSNQLSTTGIPTSAPKLHHVTWKSRHATPKLHHVTNAPPKQRVYKPSRKHYYKKKYGKKAMYKKYSKN